VRRRALEEAPRIAPRCSERALEQAGIQFIDADDSGGERAPAAALG